MKTCFDARLHGTTPDVLPGGTFHGEEEELPTGAFHGEEEELPTGTFHFRTEAA